MGEQEEMGLNKSRVHYYIVDQKDVEEKEKRRNFDDSEFVTHGFGGEHCITTSKMASVVLLNKGTLHQIKEIEESKSVDVCGNNDEACSDVIKIKSRFSKRCILEKEGDFTKLLGSSEDKQIIDNYRSVEAKSSLENRGIKTIMIKNVISTNQVIMVMVIFLSLFYALIATIFMHESNPVKTLNTPNNF